MKHFLFLISILSFNFLIFAQDERIVLPDITTYIYSSAEQKIVITKEEIEEAHYENISELVERCGIQMLWYGPYGLDSKASIRGFTDETVRVVIDGICVNNAQYGKFDLSSINLAAVEKIEIVRGGFTEGVEDEGSVAGVIYITMKKLELKKSLNTDLSLKTFFNSELPLDSGFGKISFAAPLGEKTFLNTSGTFNYAGNEYLYKLAKNFSLCDGAFGGAVTIGKDGKLYQGKEGTWKTEKNARVIDGHANAYLTHYFGNGNYFCFGDIFYGGYKNTPGAANTKDQGLQQDYDNNLSFSLWNPGVANLFNLKNNVVWMCNNRFYKTYNGKENSRHFVNTIKYTGTVDFTSLAGGHLQETAGLSADFTHLESTNDGNHIQFSGVIKETSKIAAGGGWSFSIPLAAKFCVNDNNANFAFVPKAGTVWERGFWQISADVYRMVQFPNMDDLFWEGGGLQGNPDLIPESGWGADLGFMLKGISTGSGNRQAFMNGGLTLFTDYYKDKIKWGSNKAENLSSAFYFGVDFNFEAELLQGFWSLALNGEYLYNRLLDKASKYTYGKQIMWTPDFVCNLSTALHFDLADISLSATYTGRRYTDNMNLYYLKPYVLVNLSAQGSPIHEKIVPYLKVDNLLNWEYQSVEGFAMPGISLTLGCKYTVF